MSGWTSTPSPSRIHVVVPMSIVALTICWIVSRSIAPSRISGWQVQEPFAAAVRSLQWRTVEDLPQPLAQFNTVFWEPRDTDSLREQIHNSEFVRGKSV